MMLTSVLRARNAAKYHRVIFAAGALVLAGVGVAQAATVVVQGNRRVDTETIRSYVVGGGSPEQIRQQLLATGLFSDVRVSQGGGGTIVVSVHESAVVNRVVFEGNKKLNKDALAGELQTKERGPYSPQLVQADVERLQDIYKRGGRGFAKVTSRIVDLPNGRVDVIFTIVEGDKTGVKEINFVGNKVYSGRRLRDLMTTTEMNLLSWLKTSDIYDPDKIGSDEELIRRFYLKNGYADFRIVSTDAVFDEAKGGWIVTITVDEGEPYKVTDVAVVSRIPDISEEQIRKDVRTDVGDVYDAEQVEKSLAGITTSVNRKGYAFAQVRPTGTRDSVNHTIGLSYIVEEGPRVYIEKINIRGNVRTRDYVIRREFDLEEGDAYNKILVDRAERRLNNLGYFKKVRITSEPGSTPDRIVVNVDVEDQPTGQFSVSGGYSTQDGIIGEVAVAESNFLGRGQYVRLAGTLGQRTNGVEFSFTEPYFLGQRLAAGFDIYTKYTDNTQYARYETRATGGTLRLGMPITDEFTVLLRYSLYQTDLKVPDTYKKPYNDCSFPLLGYTNVFNPLTGYTGVATGAAGELAYYPTCAYDGEASIAVKEAQGKTITSLAGVTLSYNTLDNMKDPHSGIYAELRPEIAGLGGDSRFFRAAGEARYYRELWDDIIGIVRVQGGHIQALGGDKLRLVDNYFLGPSLVRGFAPSGIGPRDLTGDPSTNAIGGTTYFGASVEAQFPIWGLPRELGLKGAVFADAGTLFGYQGNKTFDLNYNGIIDGYSATGLCVPTSVPVQPECMIVKDSHTIRTSVGASILWQSPLGPIRFDYAYALTKADGDRTQAFRFTGGGKF